MGRETLTQLISQQNSGRPTPGFMQISCAYLRIDCSRVILTVVIVMIVPCHCTVTNANGGCVSSEIQEYYLSMAGCSGLMVECLTAV